MHAITNLPPHWLLQLYNSHIRHLVILHMKSSPSRNSTVGVLRTLYFVFFLCFPWIHRVSRSSIFGIINASLASCINHALHRCLSPLGCLVFSEAFIRCCQPKQQLGSFQLSALVWSWLLSPVFQNLKYTAKKNLLSLRARTFGPQQLMQTLNYGWTSDKTIELPHCMAN